MSIAPKLHHYLDAEKVDYEILEHMPTASAMQNALARRIPPGRVAKSVLLDTPDDYLLAVLPSDRRIGLAELRASLARSPSSPTR